MHLGVGNGLLRAARRSRQIGGRALQIFTDNPTAWRRRPEPPLEAPDFVDYGTREGLRTIAIHASYLINLAGSAEPFASRSRDGLIVEMQRAPSYGATIVNTHIGSHRGIGAATGLARIVENVRAVLASSPTDVRLALENSSGGGDMLGSSVEELARILEGVGAEHDRARRSASTRRISGAPATTSATRTARRRWSIASRS